MDKVIPIVTQHADRAITRKDYDQFGGDILVTSMFLTLQGEGPYAGHPAIFIRLAGCNFGAKDNQCEWCDTNFLFDKGTRYTPEQLLEAVTSIPGYHSSQVLVITGGEPTLQHNLIPFILKASPVFSVIQIETNGTQASFYDELEKRQMGNYIKSVVSPKANSKVGRYPELSKKVMWWASCLKFVVSADPTSPHHTVPEWAFQSAKPIYVSPMAVYLRSYEGEVSSIWDDGLINKEATSKNYAYAAQYAIENNLLLSLQTHLITAIP